VWPPRTDPNRAPYRGWEPFEEIDAGVFFGRDAVIARGVDALQGMRFRLLASMSGLKSLFVVLGPSGSGKSSFLRAGPIPRLRRQDRQFVMLGILRPQGNALTGDSGLAAAIHAGRESLDLPSPSLGDIKKACGQRDVDQVVHLLREIRLAAAAQLASHAKPQVAVPTLVLPIDQAEELFSADAGPQTEEFLSMLAELIQRMNADEVGLIVAVTIRTDRYEAMQSHPALDGVGTAIFDDLKPMPREEFKEVIIGPAARATEGGKRLVIQDGLVASLLRDAGDGADTLPLVALTLSRLYADYGGTGEISAADYEAMGGMTDVVNNVIEELLSQYPGGRTAALELLRPAFIPWLATINSLNDQALRRVALESDLPQDSRPLIDAFVAKRLLVRDERDGKVVVEVALESLLRQWDTLAGWLAEERLNLKIADDIERNAAAWESQGRDESWLFTGTRLDDAEKLSTREGFSTLLAGSRAYLKACRDAEDQRLHDEEEQRNEKLRHAEEAARHAKESQQAAEGHARVLRRRSRVLAAVALVAILAAGAAIYGFITATQARKQANARTREAIAVRLTSDGRAILGGDLEGGDIRAIQEILAAPRIASTADSGALYDGLVGLSVTLKIIGTPNPVQDMSLSSDGHRIATAQFDGSLRLWDSGTGEPIGSPLTGHRGPAEVVVFSPDGRRIFSGGDDKTVRLWNADTGQQIGAPLLGHTDWVQSLAYSPNGRRLVSASFDKTLRIWDPATGQPVGQPLVGHTGWVTSVAFSPDGNVVASAGHDKTVRLWNADTRLPMGQPMTGHTDAVSSVVFSPDGHQIASGSFDNLIRLWDVGTGHLIGQPWSGHTGGVTSLAFFADGRHLVSGSQDDTVRLWEVGTGKAVGDPMKGHTGTVTGVSVSANGHRIMSGSEDKYLRLWDADTGKPIGQPLAGHSQAVNSVAFSPDRHRVVSASDDGELRLWPAPPKEDWVNLLCDKLSANMTHAEWDKWVSPSIEYIKLCPNLPDPPST